MRFVPVVFFLTLVWLAATEPTLEGLAGKLASDDPAVRAQVIGDLERVGKGSDELLEKLRIHQNPWVASRAMRIQLVRRGIDQNLAPGVQHGIANFQSLNEEDQTKVLVGLGQLPDKGFSAKVYLMEGYPADKEIPQKLVSSLGRNISTHADSLLKIEVKGLSARVRGIILSVMRFEDEKHQMAYQKWREQDPTIRNSLGERNVRFELRFLEKTEKVATVFGWLAKVEQADQRRLISLAISKDTLPLTYREGVVGNIDEALGWLVAAKEKRSVEAAMAIYRELMPVYPELPGRLFDDLLILEIKRLEGEKRWSDAIKVALQCHPGNQFVSLWLGRAGQEIGDHPEILKEEALPAADAKSRGVLMGAFLQR